MSVSLTAERFEIAAGRKDRCRKRDIALVELNGGAGRYAIILTGLSALIRAGKPALAQIDAARCASPDVFKQIPPLRRHLGQKVSRVALGVRTALMNESRHS